MQYVESVLFEAISRKKRNFKKNASLNIRNRRISAFEKINHHNPKVIICAGITRFFFKKYFNKFFLIIKRKNSLIFFLIIFRYFLLNQKAKNIFWENFSILVECHYLTLVNFD